MESDLKKFSGLSPPARFSKSTVERVMSTGPFCVLGTDTQCIYIKSNQLINQTSRVNRTFYPKHCNHSTSQKLSILHCGSLYKLPAGHRRSIVLYRHMYMHMHIHMHAFFGSTSPSPLYLRLSVPIPVVSFNFIMLCHLSSHL